MKLKDVFLNNRKILSNFSYLTILEIFLLIAPIITFPYLVRILGKELYGWVITAQVTASYCTILIEFGFKRISARHIANQNGDKNKMSITVSSIIILRFILWIISFIIYLVVIEIVESYRHQNILFIFSFLTTLSSVLFLDFYFQGIEDMKYITIVNVLVRGIFVGATFIFIKNSEDYIYVPLLWSIGYVLGGGISMWIVFNRHKLSFVMPLKSTLLLHLKEGSIIFFSDLMLSVKDKLNYNIMGSLIGMSDVVIYDVGSKISGLMQKPVSVICTVLFPRMAKNPNVNNAKKAMLVVFLISIIITIIVNVFLPFIVNFFIHEDIDLNAIRLYSISPIILSISIFIAINVFYAFGYDKLVLNSTIVTTIGYIILLTIMYCIGLLNSVESFVILTLSSYFIEMIYRIVFCNKIFKSKFQKSTVS